MAQMDSDTLKAIVVAEVAQAVGVDDTELSSDRIDGWDAYLKRPYGNEIEGRSKVVSSDVQDTVEWIMPSLMRIFTAGDASVEFSPTGPEDEQSAEQATDYCNYVWDRDNPGFLNFHTWFKESLIAKMGTVKVYWEENETWKKERYIGLDDGAYALIHQSPDAEIAEETKRPDGLYDVVLKLRENKGKICCDPVPADEVLFSRDAKDVQHCRFFAHKSKKTISDLIEQFPDKKSEIQQMSSDAPDGRTDEALHRATVEEDDTAGLTAAINRAMREVWVTECYIRVDWDDDGIAEMRQVTIAGSKNLILQNEEWEGPRPFACLSPILMPHRLVGLSIPDLIKDIQLIKTTIWRQFLDGVYQTTNPENEIDMDRVEPEWMGDYLTTKPGGLKRKRGVEPVLTPVVKTFAGDTALAGLQYVDQQRENRTGVSPRTQGLGADTLHDTKGGQDLLFDAAKMRVELIARIFAETGVKDAFKLILWNAHKYQDKARTIRLRNEWVNMDPREWSDQYDMTANVGLGHNDNEKQQMALMAIGAMQEKVVALQGGASGPMVTMGNLFNTGQQAAKAFGFKAPELFFTDPDSPNAPQPQPKPDPEMLKLQGEMQLKQMEAQLDSQLKQQELQAKMAIEKMQAEADIATKQADLQMKREEHAMKMQFEQQKHTDDMTRMKQETSIKNRERVTGMRDKRREARFKVKQNANV